MKGKVPQLPLPGEEAIQLEKVYVVLTLETFTSDVQGYLGWRVTLDGGTDDLLAIPLWVKDTVGRKSKLGAFLVALGEDPEEWIGQKIRFIRWEPKDRVIEAVK